MKKLSKGFYLGSIASAGGLGIVLIIIANFIMLAEGIESEGVLFFLLLGLLLTIYAGIISIILWYKAWCVIQDGQVRTTPGKAIGFLFIPFFDLYWIFQAYWGFSKDYNSYIKRHNISVSSLPEGLFLTSCILTLVSIPIGHIPVFGSLFSLVCYGIWIAVMNKVCDGVNNLLSSKIDTQEQVSPQTEQRVQQAESKSSGLAIAGLVCAIIGIVPGVGIVLAIIGLILGIVALKKIDRSKGKIQGRGVSIAAISVGGTLTAVWILIMPAIMIPAFIRSAAEAKKCSTMANMQVIETALEMYEIENGNYPQSLSVLVEQNYLADLPLDGWGRNFIYRLKAADDFELFSLGPDGIESSEDDIYSDKLFY